VGVVYLMCRLARAVALLALIGIWACSDAAGSEQAAQDTSLPQLNIQLNADPGAPPNPSIDPNAPSLDLRIIKSMLYADAIKHQVNPYLVMGLGWWESGWNQSAVSSAGAIGVMQIMPATAASAGPFLLHHSVDIHDINDNIDLGSAIIANNMRHYGNDLVKALTDYYGGPSMVTDWDHLPLDAKRYVWGIYHLAIAFEQGRGPV
jgi:soluble lytic murein transglycosylase-like protein